MTRQGVEIRVLGPIEVLMDSCPVALNGKRLPSLLAALLVRPRQVLTPDQLIDDVWGVRARRTARASLHNVVSALRGALGPEVLVTTSAGYALAVDDVQIDARRFETLVTSAMKRAPRKRLVELSDALTLWRGSPFVDVRYESFAQAEIVRLEELYVWALEERLEARLRLGEADAVIAELTGLVARFPLRERLRRMLMVALHRAGRPIDAVAVYVDWHRRLSAAGFVPANALSQMRDDLERQAPGLASGLLRVDAGSRGPRRYPRRTLRRGADEPGLRGLGLALRRLHAFVAQRPEHRAPNTLRKIGIRGREFRSRQHRKTIAGLSAASVAQWTRAPDSHSGDSGSKPLGGSDTVAERRGARLQSVLTTVRFRPVS